MFSCPRCNFKCPKRGDWNRHLGSKKHQSVSSDMILQMVEENKQLRSMLMVQQAQIDDILPKVGNRFNLNFFLTDSCREAVNWSEFVKSLTVQLSDEQLEDSIANVICAGIHGLGVHKRPVHCLDAKRQKLCIKNQDVWEKDAGKVRETIDRTAVLLQKQCMNDISQWEQKHPDWVDDERHCETYARLVNQSSVKVSGDRIAMRISKSAALPKD